VAARQSRAQWQQGSGKKGLQYEGRTQYTLADVEWEKWASALTPIEPDILQGHHNEIGHDGDKTR